MPGERNPPSAAQEFAPPPQGENALDAAMMADFIVSKKEIVSHPKKSAATSLARTKSPARVVNDCRWWEDMGPGIGFVGSLLRGAFGGEVRCLSLDAD